MRVGVLLPNWVGDVAMATPALRTLRKNLPDARIGQGVYQMFSNRVCHELSPSLIIRIDRSRRHVVRVALLGRMPAGAYQRNHREQGVGVHSHQTITGPAFREA